MTRLTRPVVAAFIGAAVVATGVHASNLITNGSFETGDFTGWTKNPASYPQYIVTVPVEDGTFAAQITGYSFNPDTLSQTIVDTPGEAYTLSFWINQEPYTPNGVTVTFNGATVFTQTDAFIVGYQQITASVVGSGSDVLIYTAYNDPAGTYLDNVALTNVPEPAAWALMLVGIGGVGAALRSRRQATATFAG